MKQFFKFTLASIVGFLISGILLIVIFFSVIFSLISSAESKFSSEKKVKIEENSILHLTFDTEIADQTSDNPFDQIQFGNFNPKKKQGLKSAVDAILKAKDDDRIKGVFLDLSENPTNSANIEEVRNALLDFKTSGKFIVSYAEQYTQKSFLLASLADEIHLYPTGDLDLKGLYAELMFFKGTLDKLEVDAQIIRGSNNQFKSAVEPFMYDKMSDANREQLNQLIKSLWGDFSNAYAEGRDISTEEINRIASNLLASSPKEALELKLIDKLSYRDEVIADLMKRVEVEKEKDLKFIELSKYAKVPVKKDEDNAEVEKPWEKKDKIAVVYASGEIRSGKSETDVMGSETIAKAIKDAREDSTVKAIVLRVNSPGGSALASDVIWRETMLAKEAKPFIVSMGGVAASGGYYISCAADKIYADRSTITGSIGVFGMIPNAEKMFNNKLGITFDGVKTNDNADIMTIAKGLTPYQFGVIQKSVDLIYDDFKQKVAEGRSLTIEFVDSVGQGRVWTGVDALELGLVDELGGLNDALDFAKEKAGLEDYKLVSFPKEKNPFEKFMEEFSSEVQLWFLGEDLKAEMELYKDIKSLTKSDKIQARIPFMMEIY